MKKLVFICTILLCFQIPQIAQTLYTSNGDNISPACTLQVLNIFINIVYDQVDTLDPCYDLSTPEWQPGTKNTINQSIPTFLDDYMDSEFDANNINGAYTRRFAEASFDSFALVGDFMVVNIAQSRITPTNPGATFTFK